jgi:hypothetical protein
MLDPAGNYPAASRLSLHRSPEDWGLVIEAFEYSPRGGYPRTRIFTFASQITARKPIRNYSQADYERYLANHPHSEFNIIHPLDESYWLHAPPSQLLEEGLQNMMVRGNLTPTPEIADYAIYGVFLRDPPHVAAFEFCRALAAIARNEVLATPEERRACIPPELVQIMQLEEWNHPDIFGGDRPSSNATFRQLAEVLVSGDVLLYQPQEPPNSHWSNWPDAGAL